MSIPEVKAPQGTPQAQGATPAEQPKQPDAKEIVVFGAEVATGCPTTGAVVSTATGIATGSAYAGWEFAKQTTANLFGPTIAGAEAGARHTVTDVVIPTVAATEAGTRHAVTDVVIPTAAGLGGAAATTYATLDAASGGLLTTATIFFGLKKAID